MSTEKPVARTVSRRTFLGSAAATVAFAAVTSGPAHPAANASAPNAADGTGAAGVAMNVGRGMADITGEPLGAGMNGYAVPKQISSGLHQRQFARAFVFDDGNGGRVAHVTVDMGLMFQAIHLEVIRRLQARFGNRYHDGNVLIAATHTHVAPGGSSGHLLVDITTFGFRPVTFEAYVAGIVSAVERADADVQPSTVSLTRGQVHDVGVNRSKAAFDRNPEEDKAVNPDGVDRESATLHVLRDGRSVGFINWYGIHPTTFGPEHTLISGDNKGYAAWLAEHRAGVDHCDPASAPFVAAFATSTPGDVTPNHGLHPHSGPGGEDEYASARILGLRQLDGVSGRPIELAGGGIDSRHRWVNMRNVSVDGRWTTDGRPGKTGPAILGAAFAASSQEDGGGEPLLGFNEGERGGTPWVQQVNKVVVPPSVAEVHAPKEMLLPVGYIDGLVQQTDLFLVHRIGGVVIASLPFEPTVTAGLRIRRAVAEALDVPFDAVIAQGYVNGYSHYLTTPEEYETQNYEGGATLFGRHGLPAVVQTFDHLSSAMAHGIPVDPGAPEKDLMGLIPHSPTGNPLVDLAPLGTTFGDVISGPTGPVAAGSTVSVTFVGANPNSDLRHERGFFFVETADGRRVADDSHEDTVIEWASNFGQVNTTITWHTAAAGPGEYVIRYFGSSRSLTGNLTPFEGTAQVTVQ